MNQCIGAQKSFVPLSWILIGYGKRGLVGIEDEFEKVCDDFVNKVKPDIIHAHNMNYF